MWRYGGNCLAGRHPQLAGLKTLIRRNVRTLQEWVDGRTEWFAVKVFRGAAINVAESIKKGQPVTVHGRFRTHEYEADDGMRMDLVIDATSVGHDLTRGVGSFQRSTAEEGDPGHREENAKEADAAA